MGKEEKYLTKVMDDRTLSEKIAMLIPGFQGYKEKELRRDTDQLIRNKVYDTLRTGIKDLRWCHREIVNVDQMEKSDFIDRLIMKTDKITEKIHHANRGYSGTWQAVKVREGELTEVLRYDVHLIDTAEKLRQDISQIKNEIRSRKFETITDLLVEYEDSIDSIDDNFTQREEVILGLAKGGL